MDVGEVQGNSDFVVGKWTVEPERLRISDGRNSLVLQPRIMSLLQHFAAHKGDVISHERLIETVWQGRIVEDGAVYQAMAKLRHALGDDSHHPRYIETIPTKGYRLIAPVGPAISEEDVQRAETGRSLISRRKAWLWFAISLLLAASAAVFVVQPDGLAIPGNGGSVQLV